METTVSPNDVIKWNVAYPWIDKIWKIVFGNKKRMMDNTYHKMDEPWKHAK